MCHESRLRRRGTDGGHKTWSDLTSLHLMWMWLQYTVKHSLLSQFNVYLCCNHQLTSNFISFFFLISCTSLFFMYSSLLLCSCFTFTTKSSLPFPVLLCFHSGLSLVLSTFPYLVAILQLFFFINLSYLLLAFLLFSPFPSSMTVVWLVPYLLVFTPLTLSFFDQFAACLYIFNLIYFFLSEIPPNTKYFHTLLCMLNLH